MALNWEDIQRMKRVEARADAMDFVFKSSGFWIDNASQRSAIYVKPKDNSLPIYSRDATLFTGSIESIDDWLSDIVWARQCDDLIKASNNKKRAKQEQLVRDQHLMKTIKTEGTLGFTDDVIEYGLDF